MGALHAKATLQATQETTGLRSLLGRACAPGQGAPPQLRGCRGPRWKMSLTFRISRWVRLEGEQALGSRRSYVATSACFTRSLRYEASQVCSSGSFRTAKAMRSWHVFVRPCEDDLGSAHCTHRHHATVWPGMPRSVKPGPPCPTVPADDRGDISRKCSRNDILGERHR